MRLGGSVLNSYGSPKEWLEQIRELQYSAVIFPVDSTASAQEIHDYLSCIRDNGLVIGEVGIWKNLMARDSKEREANLAYAIAQLELAEKVGANCCVNISGSKGTYWDGYHPNNNTRQTYDEIICQTRKIIDAVNPAKTFYTLEPMPWMVPDSPESYLQLVKDVDRKAFAVHMDYTNMINSMDRYRNAEAFIEKCFSLLGSWIKSIHIKDVILKDGKLPCVIEEALVGEGSIPLGKVLQLSEKLGEDMTVYVEHLEHHEDYVRSIRYLRGIAPDYGIHIKR